LTPLWLEGTLCGHDTPKENGDPGGPPPQGRGPFFFYESIGARRLNEWLPYRLTREQIEPCLARLENGC